MKCHSCGKKLPHHYMITAAGFNVCSDDCRRKAEGEHLEMNKTTDGYPNQESKHDPVNRPSHYTSHPSGVECITITRHMTFNCGNAIKYLWRSGLKGEAPAVQDLKKAAFYLNDEIKRIEEQQNKPV